MKKFLIVLAALSSACVNAEMETSALSSKEALQLCDTIKQERRNLVSLGDRITLTKIGAPPKVVRAMDTRMRGLSFMKSSNTMLYEAFECGLVYELHSQHFKRDK